MVNPKLLLLALVLGPVAYGGARQAATNWNAAHWRRWLLRLSCVLAIAGCLVGAAFALDHWLAPRSHLAAQTAYLTLIMCGMIWGVGGLVEVVFALGADDPFPFLYHPRLLPWVLFLTLALGAGVIVGGLGKALFGLDVLRGFLVVLGVLILGIGAMAPAALWGTDDRIARVEQHLGRTGARVFYALLGLAIALIGAFAPLSALGRHAT
jgi:hypothetical protein